MSVIKNSLKNQINDYNRTQFNDVTATILEYDRTSGTCKIKYPNPNGEGYIYRGDVITSTDTGGMSSGNFYPGQQCLISFINNNVYNPIITGISNSFYQEKNCTDQGAYIADDEIWKVSTQEHITAMNLDWIDDKNEDLSKYENDNASYMHLNIASIALDLITTLDKFLDHEVGMTNMKTKSTVKLRDNGDIDLFSRNNTGIRICENGNIKIYANDLEFTNTLNEMTDHSLTSKTPVARIMKMCLAYDLMKQLDKYDTLISNNAIQSTTADINALQERLYDFEDLVNEFYEESVEDDETIDKYITLFTELLDEFRDSIGNLSDIEKQVTGETESSSYLDSSSMGNFSDGKGHEDWKNELMNIMKKIESKVTYDQSTCNININTGGRASCCHTVTWVYEYFFKQHGFNTKFSRVGSSSIFGGCDRNTGKYIHSESPEFIRVWNDDDHNGMSLQEAENLQIGDVILQNRQIPKNGGQMTHTEMYAGKNSKGEHMTWSNGTSKHKGPVLHKLRLERTRRVMRWEKMNSADTSSQAVNPAPTSGNHLTKSGGRFNYNGHIETWYYGNTGNPQKDFNYPTSLLKKRGIEGKIWVRNDGCIMYGDYIILATNRSAIPIGTIVETSLGKGISCDTGKLSKNQIDIATIWNKM